MQNVPALSANKSEIVDNEKDQSVFFRQGKSDKVAVNPRLLAVDLKGPMDFPIQNQEFNLSPLGIVDWIPGEHAASCVYTLLVHSGFSYGEKASSFKFSFFINLFLIVSILH